MPSLSFILPHWLYWGALIVFPVIAGALVARQSRRGAPRAPSLFLAYLFWLCAGFVGLHRFYLGSIWGLVFIPAFLLLLHVNGLIRDGREDVSRSRAALRSAQAELTRAKSAADAVMTPDGYARLSKAEAAKAKARTDFDAMETGLAGRQSAARRLAMLLAAMLVIDALLIPGLARNAAARDAAKPGAMPPAGVQQDPATAVHARIADAIDRLNGQIGGFVAYWAVIAVFVLYYEVVARYVFNSPTNWVHESMFLMFGMQFMLAGAYAYREGQHVRVDVAYAHFSPRGKAIADIVTSIFFFIFVLSMLWTGSRFACDAIGNAEVSFTEWGVQYWPVKLMIPVGAALLALQGLAKLIRDIALVTAARA